MQLINVIEWLSVCLNLVFVILIIKQNKWGWPFGILGSILSIYLFIETNLYAEAVLYGFYVVIGIYGWFIWSKTLNTHFKIIEWSVKHHVLALFLGALGMYVIGNFFSYYTNAALPFADSFSTSFSFVATLMEAKKVLSAWIYWIILNAFSVWLYHSRGLEIYAVLMMFYTVLSVYGFLQWRKSMRESKANATSQWGSVD